MLGFLRKKKHWFEKPRILLLATIVVAVIAVGFAVSAFTDTGEEQVVQEQVATPVQVVRVSDLVPDDAIEVSGIVKPETKVEVVALVGGTVQQGQFEVGDQVVAGQVLAQLFEASVLTNLNNALTSYNNAKLSTDATIRLAEESVRQAEIGLQNAQEGLQSAQISLQSARDNLDNTLALQEREVVDTFASAVLSASDYLNTINNALDQVDFIIDAEEESQLPGIEATIAALDHESLMIAENNYFAARSAYNDLNSIVLSQQNIQSVLPAIITNLQQARLAVDSTITVLDNTVTNPSFSDATLLQQKNSFATLRSSVVTKTTSAQSKLDTLNNLALVHKQQADSLRSTVRAAESQLALAQLSVQNAQTNLDQAKQSRDSQVIGARTSLDASQGQLSLAQTQAGDLTLVAPISGLVTYKSLERGSELVPGQKVAEISQSDLVKVVIDLTSDEVYQIHVGSKVLINNTLEAVVVRIDPTADPVTRKVGVEIVFDNTNKQLIPETFVDVTIPLEVDTVQARILVPLKSVAITQTEHFVFVLDGDGATVRKVVVELGSINGDQVEIVSGLTPEDQLIVDGNKLLQDGGSVEVIQ